VDTLLSMQVFRRVVDAGSFVGAASASPRGMLTITAPVWFANARFARPLADYKASFAEVVLDVNLNGRVIDLVEEGFDLALRVTQNRGWR
jgi:DNA-binding transcriptional LysR family regulator